MALHQVSDLTPKSMEWRIANQIRLEYLMGKLPQTAQILVLAALAGSMYLIVRRELGLVGVEGTL